MKKSKYEVIEEVLNSIPENFSILEDEVDIHIQKEFFDLSESLDSDDEIDQVSIFIAELNSVSVPEEEKKIILTKLASIDSIEAYRAIEKFRNTSSTILHSWATLAYQQSRMVIESGLIGENQVFISTGLGGKKDKLRYFWVFPFALDLIDETQTKIFKSEIQFFIEKYEGEVEMIEMTEHYASITALIPIKAPIPILIEEFINECNQFGQFLREEDIIITNVKKLTDLEIEEIIIGRNDEE